MPKQLRLTISRALSALVLGLLPWGHAAYRPVEAAPSPIAQGDPPYSGTIFLDPNIITATDPTTFVGVVYTGQGLRLMFDRRVDDYVTLNAYLFNASFDDGLTAEIQVNPEFGSSAAAEVEALKYGSAIGQLPRVLRADVETVWIHMGVHPFGGGNNNILIHIGQSALYEADGILEETLVHEASHTSLDATHAAAPGWLAAQTADDNFISTYARDNPTREDIAESFLPYLALRFRLGRIPLSLANTFTATIPSRIAYFDAQSFDMYPVLPKPPLVARDDFALTALETPVVIHPLSNDGEPTSDPLTLTVLGAPLTGTNSLAGAQLVYTPTLGFLGTDVFTYTVSTATEAATATVTVLVVAELYALFLPLALR